MHGEMVGFHEVRLTDPGRRQLRLFCVLGDADPDCLRKRGFDRPQIAVITRRVKASGEKFADRDYAEIRRWFYDSFKPEISAGALLEESGHLAAEIHRATVGVRQNGARPGPGHFSAGAGESVFGVGCLERSMNST